MLLLLWNPLNMTCTIKPGKLKVMRKNGLIILKKKVLTRIK